MYVFVREVSVAEIFVHMAKHLYNRWIYSFAMARNSCLFIGLLSVKAKG
jgi:hypothetical protein